MLQSIVPSVIPDQKTSYVTLYLVNTDPNNKANKGNPYEQQMVFITPPGISIPNMLLPSLNTMIDSHGLEVATDPQLQYNSTTKLFRFRIPIYVSEGMTGAPLVRVKYYIDEKQRNAIMYQSPEKEGEPLIPVETDRVMMDEFRLYIGESKPYHYITRQENYDQARPLGHIWSDKGFPTIHHNKLNNGLYRARRCKFIKKCDRDDGRYCRDHQGPYNECLHRHNLCAANSDPAIQKNVSSTGCRFNTYQEDRRYNYKESRVPPLRDRRLPIKNTVGVIA